MIQVYDVGNTNYTSNGDCVLFPTVAEVHVILNGAWEATLEHPLDAEGRWKHLTEEAVVKMPSFNNDQLFRIRKPYKTDSGVTCTMEPIFYDCRSDLFLADVRPENKNGQQALDILCTGKYSGESDILTAATAYYEYKNLLEALVGEQDNSFINRWGGEAIFDNYTVTINARAGGDYNVEIRYGKNLPEDGMSVELDMATVTTRIYPKAYNGYEMTNHGYVDSPLINNYALVYANAITFSDVKMREDASDEDLVNGTVICDTQAELDAALRAKCLAEYDAGADKPELVIEADLILLQNTEQYADIADLETVSLGDTIHCYNTHLGFSTNARVVELTYNSLKKRVENVTLGAFKESYFDALTKGLRGIDELAQRANSALSGDGSVIAEKVKGVLNGSMAMIRTQYNIAERQDVLAILFENLDPTSDLYGALGIGTQGIMISKTRNANDTDWVWTTAMTALGIVADTIVTGLLSSADGTVYFDLDNNEMHCDKLVSTAGYSDVKNIVADVTRKYTAGGNYRAALQVYNTLYPDYGISITPGNGTDVPKIATGWSGNKRGLQVIAAVGDGVTGQTGNSSLLFDADGIVYLRPPTGSTGLDAELRMYPGYYGNQMQGYNSKVELTGYTIDIFATSTSFSNNITVGGSKSRKAATKDYDDRLLYCYEMPSPMFGDIGDGVTDEDGVCVIDIDDIFSETIRSDLQYQVFLQKCGPGDIWVEERTPTYFVVKGTPNLKFSWELKAKQAGYETERLEEDRFVNYQPDINTMPELTYESEVYELIKEQEDLLYETA